MNTKIIKACCDLGLTINGADKGPIVIEENLKNKGIIASQINKPNCTKSLDNKDLKKNLKEVNEFNNSLYNEVIETLDNNLFPITIGGDHSIAIGSALASEYKNNNLGIIWFDAHLDYNTFKTTITGNLHGLPLAAINGLCKDLTPFHNNNFINPKNTVIVGYRAKEDNATEEINNVIKAGATIIDDDYIKKHGIENAMKKAFDIASNNTNGIHFSFDLDVIKEEDAPGVSTPELGGIAKEEALTATDIICKNIDKIKSFDLVEFNPTNDIDNKTLNIALDILNKVIDNKKKN